MATKNRKNAEENYLNVPASKLPPQGPIGHKRSGDFRNSFHWRVLRILSEFIDGFQFLADFNETRTVTFFGSARDKEGNKYYETARKLAKLLGKKGYGVVTGGGPGIMEAGNRGAVEGKGESIGLNIQLPQEQRVNRWVKEGIGFHYFFSRKVMLVYSAQAYVYFPGGFGTLDEFFELVTLRQTKKISDKIPLICIGHDFWDPIAKWIDSTVCKKFHYIDKEDMKIYTIVDTPEEAWEIIKKSPHIKYF